MHIDDIVAALKAPGTIPNDAVVAAVGQAEALAPVSYELADKLCRGV